METDWRKEKLARLEKLRPLFNFLPFTDFVLIAGSLAFGQPKESSDLDVILGCRKGRIWTARFFALLIFELAGVRRSAKNSKAASADKICLNHLVTPAGYRLREPHNEYWRGLYKNLIPFAGELSKVNDFFAANADWLGERREVRELPPMDSWYKQIKEFFLSGLLGDWFEQAAKFIQLSRIHNNFIDKTKKPRIIATDEELEFHPDTLRIEEFLKTRT